jgi:hypothetical protein
MDKSIKVPLLHVVSLPTEINSIKGECLCGRRLTQSASRDSAGRRGARGRGGLSRAPLARGLFRGNLKPIGSDLQSIESAGVPDRKGTVSQSISS